MRLLPSLKGQSLVIIVVKGIQSVGVIRHYFEEGIRLVVRQQRLTLNCSPQHSNQLAKLPNLLLSDTLVYGIALYEILLQDLISPLAKLNTTLSVDSIANRDNHI